MGFQKSPWELYHVAVDFSQAVDLAAKEPAKLRSLQAKFMERQRSTTSSRLTRDSRAFRPQDAGIGRAEDEVDLLR